MEGLKCDRSRRRWHSHLECSSSPVNGLNYTTHLKCRFSILIKSSQLSTTYLLTVSTRNKLLQAHRKVDLSEVSHISRNLIGFKIHSIYKGICIDLLQEAHSVPINNRNPTFHRYN